MEEVGRIHTTLHKKLAGTDQCGKTCVTCTLVSSSDSFGHIEHHLLLNQGKVSSVADFMKVAGGQFLKITTTHSSLPALAAVVTDFPASSIVVIKFPPHNLSATTWPPYSLFRSMAEEVSIASKISSFGGGPMTLELYDNHELCVSLRNAEKMVLMSVIGSLARTEMCDKFSEVLTPLHDMHDPNDILDVTIVVLIKQIERGSPIVLYKFIAGYLKDSVKRKGNNWILTTIRVRKDSLHEVINTEFYMSMSPLLGTNRLESWKEKSLAFTVTSAQYCDEQSETIYGIQPEIVSTPEANRLCFQFSHPKNPSIHLRVWEPASPADCEFFTDTGDSPVRFSLEGANQIRRSPQGQPQRPPHSAPQGSPQGPQQGAAPGIQDQVLVKSLCKKCTCMFI